MANKKKLTPNATSKRACNMIGRLACVAHSLTPYVDGVRNGEQKRVFETDETLLFCMYLVNLFD